MGGPYDQAMVGIILERRITVNRPELSESVAEGQDWASDQ